MATLIHTLLLRGSRDTADALGFIATEGDQVVLIHPDSQYAEQSVTLARGEVEALHLFLGEMLNVTDTDR